MRVGDLVGGKYRVEERLGGGGYGDVWRATGGLGGVSLGDFAIKEFRAEVNPREFEVLVRLSHPNVIAWRGMEMHDGRLCLVMEYAEGGSAAALLRAYPAGMPWAQVTSILRDLAAALAYLHAQGVVHRDVKPDNVVFAGGAAKLCDMGLARLLAGSAATHTGHGTVAYSAPELYASGARATPLTDIYAVGVLAYELLTGRLPYGAEVPAIISGTMTSAPVPLPTGIDGPAGTLLTACLAKDPRERWDAARLLAHLAQAGASLGAAQSAASVAPRPAATAGSVNPSGRSQTTSHASPAPAGPISAAWLQPGDPAVFSEMRFRLIPAGDFMMGSPWYEPSRCEDEVRHQVTLTRAFWLKETPVTQREYDAVAGTNPSHFLGNPDRPVERVSWPDAVAFMNALSRREGLEECYRVDGDSIAFRGPQCSGYRFPTEAEWEYACRAGTLGSRYDTLNAVAWHQGNSGGETQPVRQRAPNAWGLYDMLGNVCEWTNDWHGTAKPSSHVTDPQGPRQGELRVDRGGSSQDAARAVRAAFRNCSGPSCRSDRLGFRIARSAR